MTVQNIDRNKIINQLKAIVGDDNLSQDEESKQVYGSDLTQKYKPNPLAVVFPKSHEHVVSIVRLANELKVGLVPSGGRTGYSGGAVAKDQELVVSFERFNRILELNVGDRQIKCEPGVTTKAVQEYAIKHDLFYPVDFASSGSSQIGGNIATNAGGIKVIRYGLTRNWVTGLKVVTGAGDTLILNSGLIKNACGYDFRHLFIGSEGTLGIVTEVTLQLTKSPSETRVFLMLVKSDTCIMDILYEFNSVLNVTAFEFFSRAALEYVMAEIGVDEPSQFKAPFYLLLEYESNETNDQVAMIVAEKCMSCQWLYDVVMSNSMRQREALWRYREAISMSILKKTPYKFDISVLPSRLVCFMNEANAFFESTFLDLEVVWFGHVGDGNLHLNLLKPSHLTQEEFFLSCDRLNEKLCEMISEHQGSISAEHGVGLLKKDILHYSKSQIEIEYMRSIKKVFDPNGIMNPGKVL